jgi:hypothetical protein
MRRPTLVMVLLVLAPASGFTQAPSTEFDELAASCFVQELPSLPSEAAEPPESLPVPDDPWDNLESLRPGQEIRILDVNSREVRGRFRGLSEAFLELQVSGKAMALARQNVVMVSLQPPSKAKRILLGILGGALTGISLWAEADRQVRRCWDDEGYYCEEERGLSARSAAIATAVGAAASGLAVALLKPDELVIYYRQWKVPYYNAVVEEDLRPEDTGSLDGWSPAAPFATGDGNQASQDILDATN